ncbi:MAG: hypothetical protein U9R28_02765 [Pseudomonadota bacterium]|nr:hypothetical protein [Pseudomonadota bacterium]
MNIAEVVKQMIRWVYALSPYFWVDKYFKNREFSFESESKSWQAIRNKRLFLSEFYIVGWFVAAFSLTIMTLFFEFSDWLVVILLLRIFGIVNKELGVILFGICKITEGSMVSATGRVIVLAMVNFLTAMFLFASVYQISGVFEDVPAYFAGDWPVTGLIQAINVQFTMSGAFTPADSFTWLIGTSQGMFCFVFGTIVISLFVSLLNVKPLRA